MPRPPIGKRAMTPAERQQRRRKRLRKEKLALGARAERQRHRVKMAESYVPMPAGITYWRKVTFQTTEGEREIHCPVTRPSLSIQTFQDQLEDADVLELLEQLLAIARNRGLECSK